MQAFYDRSVVGSALKSCNVVAIFSCDSSAFVRFVLVCVRGCFWDSHMGFLYAFRPLPSHCPSTLYDGFGLVSCQLDCSICWKPPSFC